MVSHSRRSGKGARAQQALVRVPATGALGMTTEFVVTADKASAAAPASRPSLTITPEVRASELTHLSTVLIRVNRDVRVTAPAARTYEDQIHEQNWMTGCTGFLLNPDGHYPIAPTMARSCTRRIPRPSLAARRRHIEVIMTSTAETASRNSLTSKRPRAQHPHWLRLVGFTAGTAAMTALCTLAPQVSSPAQASTTDSLQPTSSASASAPNDLQHSEAIIKPSVIFVQTKWTGYLVHATLPGSSGDVDVASILSGDGSAPKLTVTTTSSGWVANSDGYVVAAGHAVDDQPGRYGGSGLIIQAAVDKFAEDMSSNGTPLSPSDINTILEYGYANWKVEGQDGGSPPDRVVTVFPTQAAFGVVASNPLTANVVSVRSFTHGDVALLKVTSETPLPALELAPGTSPSEGTAIVAAGYPGSVSETVDPSSEPSMKDGTVSGQQTVAGVPFTEISAAIAPGMSGAAVADLQGRVVGTVSWQPDQETQAFNFMTATSTVRDILASNGVPNTLSPADRTYRTGLMSYARHDRPLVSQLHAGLQRLGYGVWIDDSLSGGKPWWDVLLRRIRLCDAIIVAVSPALLESHASTLEREYARQLGKAILPVCVRPVRPELMPPDLAAVQMVDYSEPSAAAAFELADALAHLPASPDLPESLPEPPAVPLSYLSDLTARVRAPSLTLDEQLALVSRLRSALGKETEHQPAMELLRTLQRREDLYHEPAREIASIRTAEQAAAEDALKDDSVAAAPSIAEAVAD
jgi:S1-C subfamily serine protease